MSVAVAWSSSFTLTRVYVIAASLTILPITDQFFVTVWFQYSIFPAALQSQPRLCPLFLFAVVDDHGAEELNGHDGESCHCTNGDARSSSDSGTVFVHYTAIQKCEVS